MEENKENQMEEPWVSYLMDDIPDWDGVLYLTYIVGRNYKPVRIYIGISMNENQEGYGIWIRGVDYDYIDHSKSYILIHEPEIIDNLDEFKVMVNELRSKDHGSKGHFHVTRNIDINDVYRTDRPLTH